MAQLYRRAHNAKTVLERYLTAYYFWEAGLKLLGCTAVVEYAERPMFDPQLAERLACLARPSLGHWWEFCRRLVPILADGGDPGFTTVRELLLGRTRDDLPRAAGLDAALREALEGKGGAQSTVRLTELFDRLVRFRNRELGHGAAGRREDAFYERMGGALLAGVAEIISRLPVLACRRLLYLAEVRQAAGAWLVQRYELAGESARRVASLELPWSESSRLPKAERLYLEPIAGPDDVTNLRSLHPLLTYDAEAGEVLFLNARPRRQRAEYLSYTTGRLADRRDDSGEHQALLARITGTPVAEVSVDELAAKSQAEEPQTSEVSEDFQGLSTARHLGEFELISVLGRGGMGVVYRAWQPSLGRQIALKCLLRAGDPKAEARFAREIRALGRIENPHLVKVFTSGSDGDQWFYAMELIEGANLASLCDKLASRSSADSIDLKTWQEVLSTVCEESRRAEKALSNTGNSDTATRRHGDAAIEAELKSPCHHVTVSPRLGSSSYVSNVVELIQQVSQAAHALHEAGVIHRDIKPGNVMVTADGGQAVLMDLGLAQLADDLEGRLTRTRQFVGTLRYASPEQVMSAGRLDRRSDVYSLGATLWELLTLRPLYGATDEMPTPELMQRIQFKDPEPVCKYHPAAGKDLEAVVMKCLEKDPDRRYKSAEELADELGRYLRGEPVHARPVGQTERAWRWCKRYPLVASLVTAVAVLMMAGTGVSAYFAVLADRRAANLAIEKERADTGAKLAYRHSYVSDMLLAQMYWERNRSDHVRELLDRQLPERKGGEDLRRFEWYYLARYRAKSTNSVHVFSTGQFEAYLVAQLL